MTVFARCDFTSADNTLLQDYIANGSDTGCSFAHPAASYQPAAVNFDGNTSFGSNADPITSPGSEGFLSMWFRAYDSSFGNDFIFYQENTSLGEWFGVIIVEPWSYPFNLYLNFQDLNNDNYFAADYATQVKTGWHHLLIAWSLAFPLASRRVAVYIDDRQCPLLDGPFEFGDAIVIPYDTNRMWVCSSTQDAPSYTSGDFADVFAWYNSTTVQADGTINESDRRRFIDAYGHPVDPSGALTAYGSPIVEFRGPAVNFPSNEGTGGAFTVAGALTDATSPPSFEDGIVVGNQLVVADLSTSNNVLYEVTSAPQADYSVQFTATITDTTANVSDGSSLYAMLRAVADGGYKLGLQVNGGQFQAFVDTGTAITTVNAGDVTTPDSSYTMLCAAQGTQLSVAVQRASDSFWLNSDTTWGAIQVNAITITDSTFATAGKVLIGGTWIGS